MTKGFQEHYIRDMSSYGGLSGGLRKSAEAAAANPSGFRHMWTEPGEPEG